MKILGESLHDEDNSVGLISGSSGFWYSRNATDQLPFVCEIPPVIHSPSHQCPTGTFVGLGRDCFAFGADPKTWLRARDDCVKQSGSLASVHDSFTNDLLMRQLNSSRYSMYWLGAYNMRGSWQWSDSSVFDYTNWSKRKWKLEVFLVRSAAHNIYDYLIESAAVRYTRQLTPQLLASARMTCNCTNALDIHLNGKWEKLDFSSEGPKHPYICKVSLSGNRFAPSL